MLGNVYRKSLKGLVVLAKPFISKWRYDYWKFSIDYGTFRPGKRKVVKNTFKNAIENEKKDIVKSKFHKKRLIWDYMLSFTFMGAEPEDYFMHNFHELSWKERNRFFTLRRLNFFKRHANPQDLWYMLNDKVKFNEIFDGFLKRKWCAINKVSCDEFADTFSKCDKIIVKPIGGNCGKGIYTVDVNSENLKSVYKKILEEANGEEVIVEEYFYQKGILHEINPNSLNTLRVSTVKINGRNELCEAYFRTGCGDSVVDNFHSGGIIFPINNETGKCYSGFNILGERVDIHPLSKVHIAGMTIPHWEEIKELCYKAHNILPEELHWIGWDVCLSDDDILLIEGNAGPGTYNENINHWGNVKGWLKELYNEA